MESLLNTVRGAEDVATKWRAQHLAQILRIDFLVCFATWPTSFFPPLR